jgi:hypothetical protein
MNQLVPLPSLTPPALVAAAGEHAGMRFLEFFAANIRNRYTRRADARAADEFLAWSRPPACRRSAPCSRWTSPPGSRAQRGQGAGKGGGDGEPGVDPHDTALRSPAE